MSDFDLIRAPLEGRTLIEASAGTGKTHALSSLYVRLLLETAIEPRGILVVTFTEAAASDLRKRIRAQVHAALDLAGGSGPGPGGDAPARDEALVALLRSHVQSPHAVERLQDALHNMDEASIFTIHGFCQRVLQENAFESGASFDGELTPAGEDLRDEFVADFWRRHLFTAPDLLFEAAAISDLTPKSLSSLAATMARVPLARVVPETAERRGGPPEEALRRAYGDLRTAWSASRDKLRSLLLTEGVLQGNKYRPDYAGGWIDSVERYVAGETPRLELPKHFEKFTRKSVEAAVKKGKSLPDLAVFAACTAFLEAHRSFSEVAANEILSLRVLFAQECNEELRRRRERRGVFSFDDILINLHRALHAEGGSALAVQLRQRFPAALVDEFQDTDPVQYAIFERIYSTPKGRLFLIGDPKQAIYSFRGADVFTYLSAAAGTPSTRRHGLRRNWRSEPALIAAVNSVFRRVPRPFLIEDIDFVPAEAADQVRDDALTVDGRSEAPLQVWFVPRAADSKKPLNAEEAKETVSRAVAAEAARLLGLAADGRVRIGSRPLRPQDLAVLVRRRHEAFAVEAALREQGIPSALHGADSVFESREARELEVLLLAVAEPHHGGRVKAALATGLVGLGAQEILVLDDDEERWQRWMETFERCRILWREAGVLVMLSRFLAEQGSRARLLAFDDGERSVTNFLHLAELLHEAESAQRLGPPALIEWLGARRSSSSTAAKEHEVRLETDDDAVRVLTLHSSKGLQFPVVFCPFLWHGERSSQKTKLEPVVFHDPQHQSELCVDLGSAQIDEHKKLAEREKLSEELRLAYVGLTRARNRAYLAWGAFNDCETSALAHLFHALRTESTSAPVDLGALRDRVRALSDEERLSALREIEREATGSIAVRTLGAFEPPARLPPPPEEALEAKTFRRSLDREWKVASFSLLARQGETGESPDRDAALSPVIEVGRTARRADAAGPTRDIFGFPQGSRAGSCLHAVLEDLDFASLDRPSAKPLVAGKLQEHGFGPEWVDAVLELLERLHRFPLDPAQPGLTLGGIAPSDRWSEVEFLFPLRRVTAEGLNGVFSRFGLVDPPLAALATIGRLEFAPAQGFLKGFIDLVFRFAGRFYLLDWKSNFLGPRVEDYAAPALTDAMHRELYFLQYSLYTVALDRLLASRLPGYSYEEHFGGVFYVFLRGIDPAFGPHYGVFRDRPSPTLAHELARCLIDATEAKS
jgi:exodeoxyribonuclease V beta subunit